MQVLIEFDLDGTTWSVRQDSDRFMSMSSDGVCDNSESAVRILGAAVGKMLVALISDSASTTPSDLMDMFQGEITRRYGICGILRRNGCAGAVSAGDHPDHDACPDRGDRG